MGRRNSLAKWTLPTVIDPDERRCMMIPVPDDPYHVAAFRGALLHLSEAYKWADDPDHKAREVALVWRDIIDGLEWGCGVPEDECRNFNTAAGFITYEPQNPFTQPDLIPSGYILPPWRVLHAGSIELLLGYEIGDVLTDLTRFYGGTGVITDPESGFARFRISVTGVGIVQIYFLNVPLGGMALVVADSDILTTNIVELQVDLFSIPIEDNEVIIHEVEFETEGDHYIDVTMIPRVNDEATFFNYGGGIRKVKLCGFEEATEAMVFDIRQKPDEPCIIQSTDDGIEWVDKVNIQLCPPKIRVNDGVIEWQDDDGIWHPVDTGDERVDGTAPVPYPDDPDGNCLAAENITAVYQSALTEIRAGITAGRDLVAIAAGISGIMTAFMPLAVVTTIAFALTATALAVGGAGLDDMLDEESLENFKCSVFCNIETDGSITASDFTALRAAMDDWAETVELEIINVWLDAFGSVGLQRMAKAGGITTGDCASCGCNECPDVNFSTANYTAIIGAVGAGGRTGNCLQSTTLDASLGIQLEISVSTADCSANQVDFWVYIDWSTGLNRNVLYELRDASGTVIQSGFAGSPIPERAWTHMTVGITPDWSLSTCRLWLRTGAEGQAGLFKLDDVVWSE